MNQISEQQANKVAAINENFEAIKPAELFGVDRALSVGLVFAFYGGILYVNGSATAISAGTVALSGSTTNYIERTLAGVVSANTTGFSANRIPLYTAVTTSVGISALTDYRSTNYEATGRLSKSVAGSGDVTLTAAEARNRILHLTGVLTGNRNVIVPAMVRDFIVFNATSGAFSLTVKTAAGAGVAVTQSSTTGAALSCDGTDVLVVGSAGSGEVNTASNIGSAGVGVFAQKVGADLQFRKIESGHPALNIDAGDSPDEQIVFDLEQFVGDDGNPGTSVAGLVPPAAAGDAAAGKFLKADGSWETPAGGGGGEVNTASNVGTAGVGLFAQKVGTDLQFRKIESGHPALTISDADSPEEQVVFGLEEFVGDDPDSPAPDPQPGVVPAPAPGDAAAGKFLKADGTWDVPPGGGSSAPASNLLINGGFQINQRATTSAQADDTYGHDRWYRLTQSNAIAVSTLTDVENGLPFMARLTQSNASAQRMGYAQIIEGKNCKHLRGQQVTFRIGRTRLSTSANIRFAVLEWAGTEDVVTSDVVNDWTSGTYTAGNFFLGSNLTVSGVTQQALTANTLTDGNALTVTLGSSFNNLIVFAWTESTVAQNVTFDLGRVQLESGASASAFQWRQLQEEIGLCQRYYYQINALSACRFRGLSSANSLATGCASFPVDMRTEPTVILGSDAFNDGNVNESGIGNVAATANGVSSGGFTGIVRSASTWTINGLIQSRFSASAEL